jgi:hypothetical protein
MIKDELDEDDQASSPVVERDVTVGFLFPSFEKEKEIITYSREFKMMSSKFWISVGISSKISR